MGLADRLRLIETEMETESPITTLTLMCEHRKPSHIVFCSWYQAMLRISGAQERLPLRRG